MSNAWIAITILWIFVLIYAVAASIDFGSGFWSMYYYRHTQTKATIIANRYLSPSWEITNTFIVLITVALMSFFPGAAFELGTVLLLPASLVILFLLIRSAFMVFSHSVKAYRRLLAVVSGITGILIPAVLILILPITQGGYIREVGGADRLLFSSLLTSPQAYSFIGMAVFSTLFLSSMLLADYSHVSEEWEAYRIYRRDAMILGPISLLMSVLIVVTMRMESHWLFTNLYNYFPWLVASLLSFLIGYSALWWKFGNRAPIRGRPRIAVIGVVVQYLLASYAYGSAHLPYIVYPDVTIASGFTNPNMFRALFYSYIIGFAILAPGFVFFWRMFMKDRRYLKQVK